MAYTKFGEFVRILRVKNHEVLGDTAKMLGTSLPFLSAVEHGKECVPAHWAGMIAEHYGLSAAERQELDEATESSNACVGA